MHSASLLWAPPVYFLYYAAAAALLPFLSVYYLDLGLKGSQIGVLAGMPPLLALISAPAWSAISDITRRHKTSLLLAIGGAVGTALVLPATRTFAWLLLAVVLFSFFYSPIMPLVDSATLRILGPQKEHYGRIRLWGAAGWGVAAPLVGWLIESRGLLWSFWSYAALLGLALPLAMRIPVTQGTGAATYRDIVLFLKSARWLAFLAVTYACGMALSMISNYLFIFMSELGADELLLGLTLTVATLSEIPVLFFSNRLLRRWNGQQLVSAALLLFAVRAAAYSFMAAPRAAFLIQLLHGPTFSLMWIAGVTYADKIAPAGLAATAQGLFSGVMLGIGSAAGAFLGGLLYEQLGLVTMFRWAALIALLGAGLMGLVEKRTREGHV